MNGLLRQIENLQDFLYIVEDFLENCKDNELIEFLSEHWKECLFGSIGAYLAFSYSSSYIMVINFVKLKVFHKKNREIENSSVLLIRIQEHSTGKM